MSECFFDKMLKLTVKFPKIRYQFLPLDVRGVMNIALHCDIVVSSNSSRAITFTFQQYHGERYEPSYGLNKKILPQECLRYLITYEDWHAIKINITSSVRS